MIPDTTYLNISQLVSPGGTGASRGSAMRDLDIIANAAIAVDNGRIIWVGPERELPFKGFHEVDCDGSAVIPALIDPHTHAAWGGDRYDDFEARVAGVSYETILARGGGIRRTIAMTTATPAEDLYRITRNRVERLQLGGAATVEVKSGYGFTREGELASLEAIARVATESAARVMATLLIHVPPVVPGERADYLDMVCRELIPEVTERGLATAVDVFIEREAFTVAEAERIFAAAQGHGLAVKAHVDQFAAIGGVALAIEHQALSVDHLEASGPGEIAALAGSDTVATILPGVSLHLGLPAAPGRALIDAGAIVALGTDCNPGSSPLYSPQLALALAVRLNGLTLAEALTAATANAAAALGRFDIGRLAAGMHADMIVLDGPDWREIVDTLGGNVPGSLYIAGEEVW